MVIEYTAQQNYHHLHAKTITDVQKMSIFCYFNRTYIYVLRQQNTLIEQSHLASESTVYQITSKHLKSLIRILSALLDLLEQSFGVSITKVYCTTSNVSPASSSHKIVLR